MYALQHKQLVVGQLQTNCYLIFQKLGGEALIVDPGDDAIYISQIMSDLQLIPVAIVGTHGHFDHILAAFELQGMYKIPFLIHAQDTFLVKRMRQTARFFLGRDIVEQPPTISGLLSEKKTLKIGAETLTVIHTPGHTPGSISLYSVKHHLLFSGDTLFVEGGVGRTDFEYSSATQLKKSLSDLLALPEAITIYPGHGRPTTIKEERVFHLN
jgi:glyoxylase-like metal-dependent hydrolase (beta-lactamase superfamily II)